MHPYCRYENARKIIDYRSSKEKIIEDKTTIGGFNNKY
jgi:hypothetical protein